MHIVIIYGKYRTSKRTVYWFYRRRASFGLRHAIEACGRFRGAAHHRTARRTYVTPAQHSCSLWTRWTVRQQLTLRRHQAGPKPRLGSLCVLVSGRARARNAPWYWSTLTSKSGVQPRDERSRHPSLGLPRVGTESDRGRPIFSGPVNLWRKSLASTFFSIQDGCTSKLLPDSAASV